MKSLRAQRGFIEFIPLASAAVSALSSFMSSRKANEQTADSASAQMAFQERMSNTAHQREVADLRAAGLNPILSGTGGHGSTTPAGASSVFQPEAGPALEKGISTALAVNRQKEELELIRSQADAARAQPYVASSQIELNRQAAEREKATAENIRTETINLGGPKRENLIEEVRLTRNRATEALASAHNHEAQIWLNKARTTTEGHSGKAEEIRVEGMREELKKLRNQGAVNETQYGAFLSYLEALTRAIGFGSSASFGMKR